MPGRPTGRPVLIAALLFLGLLAVPATPGDPPLPHLVDDVEAQGPLTCRACAFTLDRVSWNDSASPGGVLTATYRITNTGETEDSYKITTSVAEPAWQATLDKETTDTVPPGSGLFAAEDNEATFSVSVLVPLEARAGASTTITITVTSSDMPEDRDGRQKSDRLTPTVRQVVSWTLACSEETTVQRGREADITFTATNTGNGLDTATIEHASSENITTVDLPRFELAPGASDTQNGTIGASLRLDEGFHSTKWRLVDGRGEARATCTAGLIVEPVPVATRGGGGKESPPLTPIFSFALLAVVLVHIRRRPH